MIAAGPAGALFPVETRRLSGCGRASWVLAPGARSSATYWRGDGERGEKEKERRGRTERDSCAARRDRSPGRCAVGCRRLEERRSLRKVGSPGAKKAWKGREGGEGAPSR